VLRATFGLILFAVAFGYVEAAVVVYLRHIYAPLRQAVYPGFAPGDLFPLIPREQIPAGLLRMVAIEVGRELATLLMLAGAGVLAARRRGQWMAGFAVSFGVWDIAFYVFLKLFLDWPASLLTWDLLFLIPVPWAGPVLAPVIVSSVLITCGLTALRCDWQDHPIEASWRHWIGLVAGGLVVIVAFTWEYRALMAGASPEHFPWALFAVGLGIGLVSFGHAVGRRMRSVRS
jgi:hypothetical protein